MVNRFTFASSGEQRGGQGRTGGAQGEGLALREVKGENVYKSEVLGLCFVKILMTPELDFFFNANANSNFLEP